MATGVATPWGYRIAYWLGFAPWERAGRQTGDQLSRLLDREEADRGHRLGKALDIGCGRGAHTLELAARGWQATGVDAVPHAIERARSAAGSTQVPFVLGDVTRLADSGVGHGFDFFLDFGCLHGLTDAQRVAAARGITEAATPTATMLMMAFHPGHRGPLPHGVDRVGIETSFTEWQVVDEEATGFQLPGPLRSAVPTFYRLRRR
jgi:SAM-dependent methyltransferase